MTPQPDDLYTLPCGSCGGNSWHNGLASSGSSCAYCRDGEVCVRLTDAMVKAACATSSTGRGGMPGYIARITVALRAALEAGKP